MYNASTSTVLKIFNWCFVSDNPSLYYSKSVNAPLDGSLRKQSQRMMPSVHENKSYHSDTDDSDRKSVV